jgi:hypothetical protein
MTFSIVATLPIMLIAQDGRTGILTALQNFGKCCVNGFGNSSDLIFNFLRLEVDRHVSP